MKEGIKLREEQINVCYGISDKKGKYAKVLGTSICSLLENTEAAVTVHIFHDETLSEDNREKLSKMTKNYGQAVRFYNVMQKSKTLWEELNKSLTVYGELRFTIGTFFRLHMGEMLREESRAIYLDADTIVNMDIKDLWERDTAAGGVAAVPDIVLQNTTTRVVENGLVVQEEYFNAGVLLIDLEKFRQIDNIAKKVLDFIVEYHPEALDQDFLNHYFPHSAILPENFNCFVWRGKQEGGPKQDMIYHYVNHSIGLNMDDEFNKLYFKYFVKTPWCDENFIGNLAKKIEECNFEYLNLVNKCAGKKRLVIGLSSARELIEDHMEFQKSDIYIPYEKLESYSVEFMKGRDIFLIFLTMEDYDKVKSRLINLGLQEGFHFFDMFSLMGISNRRQLDYETFMSC